MFQLRQRRRRRYDYASKGIRIGDEDHEGSLALSNDGSKEGDELTPERSTSNVAADSSRTDDCSMELDRPVEEVTSWSLSDMKRSAVGALCV